MGLWDMVGGGAQIKMESHAAAPGARRREQRGDGQIGNGEKRKRGMASDTRCTETYEVVNEAMKATDL